jgi:hypothetical protein
MVMSKNTRGLLLLSVAEGAAAAAVASGVVAIAERGAGTQAEVRSNISTNQRDLFQKTRNQIRDPYGTSSHINSKW